MKIAFISGANRGIGFHIASNVLALPEYGLVMLAGRNERAVREAVSVMEEAAMAKGGDVNFQGRVEFVPLDLADAASVASSINIAGKILGGRKIDSVINNAGFAYGFDCELPVFDQASHTVNINYTNTRTLLDGLIPLMQPNTGRIVQLGSRAGNLSNFSGNPDAKRLLEDASGTLTAEKLDKIILGEYLDAAKKGDDAIKLGGWPGSTYSVSKAAINTYVRLLARSDAAKAVGVKVNVVCPGWCKTDMTRGEGHKTSTEGADTPTWLATSSDPVAVAANGEFFGERKSMSFVNAGF